MNVYHRALSPDDLTTIVYAVIEPDRDRLSFVNAGHPPPLLVPARGAAGLLAGAPPPLGGGGPPPHPVRRGGLEPLRDGVVSGCPGPWRGDDDVTALFVRAEPELGPSARFTLSPDGAALGGLRRMLRRWLVEAGATPDDVAAVTMAANEAWENAIEHAHAFAPVPISVAFERRGDDVFVTTHDAGGGAASKPDPDRGRGLDLMRALVDEASFSFGGRYGGSVVLRRHLGAPRHSA